MRRRHTIGLLTAATLGSFGCVDNVPPTDISPDAMFQSAAAGTAGQIASVVRARLNEKGKNHDVLFKAAAELEPWFGGLYLDNGQLTVVSTDTTIARPRVAALVEGVLLAARRGRLAEGSAGVRVVRGRYSFAELSDWLSEIRPHLHRHGVHGVTISERENAILLQVESSGAEGALVRWIGEAGIPEGAVTVRVSQRGVYTHHWGGDPVDVQRDGTSSSTPPSPCTLTQVVTRRLADFSLSNEYYGITNSHCTSGFGSNGLDKFISNGTFIADAIWDHPRITDVRCQGLTGTTDPMCRYSDAALFKYRDSFVSQLKLHQVRPEHYDLLGEDFVLVGETVNKYGRTTLHTDGEIVNTCYDILMPPQGHITYPVGVLCQYQASYASASGDSGGPVYALENWDEWTEERRFFVGIHTIKLPDGTSLFSGYTYLALEIVPDTPGWGTICLSLSGPGVTPGSSTCAW